MKESIYEKDPPLAQLFGVRFIAPQEQCIVEARSQDLYYYQVFAGAHEIQVERGDCVFYLDQDKQEVFLKRGPVKVSSPWLATVIRGYMPENKSSELRTQASLPYVNGCATRQVFPPERLGDPTLQLLDMPPYSSEQVHHIHSTVRVVYVLQGRGWSSVGMDKKHLRTELYPGQIIVLEKMCPHHFETDQERLIVLPLHIFSSVGALEKAHPMFHGTYLIE
jgi:mannose-6-phosphate isomerase-like protein (cupin superfamily)